MLIHTFSAPMSAPANAVFPITHISPAHHRGGRRLMLGPSGNLPTACTGQSES